MPANSDTTRVEGGGRFLARFASSVNVGEALSPMGGRVSNKVDGPVAVGIRGHARALLTPPPTASLTAKLDQRNLLAKVAETPAGTCPSLRANKTNASGSRANAKNAQVFRAGAPRRTATAGTAPPYSLPPGPVLITARHPCLPAASLLADSVPPPKSLATVLRSGCC